MTEAIWAAFLVTAFASGMPLMLAAVGETVGEQAGVLNLGIEGMMLLGGYLGFVICLATGSFWLGFFCGALAGAGLGALAALLTIVFGANQIVVGIGMTLAGTGVSSMLYDSHFADSRPRLGSPGSWTVPLLSDIPVLGPSLFSQHGMFYLALLLAGLTSFWLWRSSHGLRLRVAGQNPVALDAAGGSVLRARFLVLLFGGALAGLGGAYLALVSAGTFTPGMTHGLGFLAVVVAMLGRGRMLNVVLLSLAYGLFVSFGTALQVIGISLPSDVVTMAPFVAVMVALMFLGGRSGLPPALATPYVRGAR